MASILVEVEGVDTIFKNLGIAGDRIALASAKGVVRAGDEVVFLAQNEYVPIGKDPEHAGTLQHSIKRRPDPIRGYVGQISIVVSAGDPDTLAQDYALLQHENLLFHHEHGGAKYLELPLLEVTPKVKGYIDEAVAAELSGTEILALNQELRVSEDAMDYIESGVDVNRLGHSTETVLPAGGEVVKKPVFNAAPRLRKKS